MRKYLAIAVAGGLLLGVVGCERVPFVPKRDPAAQAREAEEMWESAERQGMTEVRKPVE